MRIRYLILDAYGRGGTIRTTLSMASALAEKGHDVEVASVVQRRRVPHFQVSPAVRLVSLTGIRPRRDAPGSAGNAVRWATRAALRRTNSRLAHPMDARCADLTLGHDLWLRQWLSAQKDCVVVGTRMSINLALARLRRPDQVAVAQEHNHIPRAAAVRQAYVEHFPGLDALATLTEGDANDYRALLGDTCPVVTVPNALPHGTPLRRSPLTAPVAVAAGLLNPRKGFDLLIDAWRLVAPAFPDWQLRIYGGGPLRGELAERVERAGLVGTVHLEGFDPDLASRLDEASVFVLSSRHEGLPMVILEAMAAGLPVVAFDCPTGPAELLEGGRAGVLVPRGDVEALADGIRAVLGDTELRHRLGDASAARVRDFDIDVTAATWERLFARLGDARGLSLGR